MEGTCAQRIDPLDLLLVGVEVSLWLAEQLANDLRLCFPKLRVMAISANKVIRYQLFTKD